MDFAGFWQRFFAGWIDFFVLLPFTILFYWLGSFSRTLSFIFLVPHALLYFGYTVSLHARTGQTLGKRALGIRVVALDGALIGWHQAFLRSSVDLLFSVLWIVGGVWGWLVLTDTEFASLGGWALEQRMIELQPPFFSWVNTASTIWVWSEVIVMLFNRQRRALHDFIARTVVIKVA